MFHPIMLLIYIALGLLGAFVFWLLKPAKSDDQVLADLRKAKNAAMDRVDQIDRAIREKEEIQKEVKGS